MEQSRAPDMRVAGYTLVEVIFVAGLVAVLSAVTIPQTLAMVDRSRAVAAARYLGARVAGARARAVQRSASVALRFSGDREGIRFGLFADGNHNGVRTRDIQLGIDPPIEPEVRLSDLFPGVEFGLDEDGAGRPIRLGGTTLMSFTPSGTATSGTVYLRGRDGSQFAVRVLGVTGRSRVLRYVQAKGAWADLY